MLRTLNRYGALLGYRAGKPLTILNEDAKATMLRETADRLGYKLTMAAIERNEDRNAQMVNREYAFTVKRAGMVDYDGILTEGLKLLWKMSPDDQQEIALEELLIDECQDNAAIDWDIIDAIPAQVKLAVGDDLQSCYRFRGARPELFVERAKVGKFFTLEHNYRSDQTICAAANSLISHNSGQLPKIIRPVSQAGGGVSVEVIEHSRDEGSRILQILRRWRAVAGIDWQEMAVLARTNAIVDEIRTVLFQVGVPVADDRGRQLPADWSLCIVALQLMQDPANNILCEQYLKGRMVAAAVVNRLKMEAMKKGCSMVAMDSDGVFVPTLPVKCDLSKIPKILAQMHIGVESVTLVHDRIQALPMKNAKLADLLADLWSPDDWSGEARSGGVTVCTAHRGKGREWDAVIVAGMEEGVMPSLSKQSTIEEERRISFVCATRARHKLVLAWCRQRFQYGKVHEQIKSRFVDEMTVANHP